MWYESVYYAINIKNRMPYKANTKKFPCKCWFYDEQQTNVVTYTIRGVVTMII